MLTRTVATWILALFVFSIPYENGVTLPGVGSVARLIGFVAIGAAALSMLERDRLRIRGPSLFLVVAATYVLWNVLSVFWSIVPNVSLGDGTSLLQLAAMAWMIHQLVQTEDQRDLLAQAYVFGAYATISIALSEFVRATDAYYRTSGGINPNWFAIACAFGIPIAWGLALRAKHRFQFWINALYPAFAVIAVVLSASRGGLITMLVALTVVPLTMPRLGMGKRIFVVAALGTFVWGTFVLAPQTFPGLQRNIERLQDTTEELEGGTLTGRTTIWASGMGAFWSSPLVGVGAGGFRYAVEEHLGSRRAAHNAYLSVAVGSGLVGLFLFIAMIGVVFIGIVATRARRIELLVLLTTICVGMMPANLEGTKSIWFVLSWLAVMRPLMLTSRHVNTDKTAESARPPAGHTINVHHVIARQRATLPEET